MLNESVIKFIIARVINNAIDAREEAEQNKNEDFYEGRRLAYYEILDTIKSELIVRDQNLTEFGLDMNLEKEFLA